jgi:hypothetical protein
MLLKASSKGNEEAQRFFEASGEESQEKRGAPEALIIFTSKEIIEGKSSSRDVNDNWFRTNKGPVSRVVSNYLSKLFKALGDDAFSPFYREGWIRDIHFVAVNHQDLYDCFPKCYATMNALREKEIWINMVGGSNPINASLILSAGFVEATAKTYYVFEQDTSYLHPQIKSDFSNPVAEPLLPKINILPFFSLDLGKLTRNLNQKFLERGEKVNRREIESILNELKLPQQYLKKLVSGGWIKIEKEIATAGEMLERWNKMLGNIKEYPADYPTWKKWASREGILYDLQLDGTIEKIHTN